MKLRSTYFYILLLSVWSFSANAQNSYVDSLKGSLAIEQADSNKVKTLINLSAYYQLNYPDSSFIYAQLALILAEKLHYDQGIFWAAAAMDGALIFTGNYPLELDCAFKALTLSKKLNTPRTTAFANGMLSDYYYNLGDYASSLSYWREVIKIAERWFPGELANVWANLSRIYDSMNEHDSAMIYAKKTYAKIKSNRYPYSNTPDSLWLMSLTSTLLGNAFAGLGNYDSAIFYYHIAIPASMNLYMHTNLIDGYNGIASTYKAKGNLDSAVWYAKKVLTAKIARSYPVSLLKAANLLSGIYEREGRPDSALKYLHQAAAIKDSLFSREKMITIQNLTYKEQEKQQEIAAAKIRLQHRYNLYFLAGGFLVLLVAGGVLLKNKRQRQLQRMRNRIADDLHDDIGSTLSSISIMSELARERSPQAQSLLASIGESTNIIQENMSDIIWTVKPGNDRFENILQRMNEFASEILEAKNIAFEFVSDAAVPASRLNMEQRKNFYLFFKEVINNAAKHSDATKVSVNISQKDHVIAMCIRDNGKGFDSSKPSGGNGLTTLKKRAAGLHASFNTISTINKGTVVQLSFTIT